MTNNKFSALVFIPMSVLALAVIVSAMATTPALARQDARKMSCKQVKRMIYQRGAVVLTTGRYTYERYVLNTGFCDYNEIAQTRWIKTSDTRRCRVRICEDASLTYPFLDD